MDTIDNTNPFAVVADMVKEAEIHADDMSYDRVRAAEYYRGEMKDTPAEDGRSQIVSRDVRAHMKKVLPSIIRTILGSDEIVEFLPGGPNDEEGAQQASDYINYVIGPEANLHDAVYDAVHDAGLLRNGVLKWWYEERKCVKISSHSGLDEEGFAQLAGDESVEVMEFSESPGVIDGREVMLIDAKIKRMDVMRKAMVAAVPRERFLIHPDATTLEDSLLTGEKTELRRSDLIAMGYDRKTVDDLPLSDEDDYEEESRRDFVKNTDESHRPNDPIDYYDLYVRYDADGDGIAELRHMCFAGGLTEKHLLIDEECDEVQFADVALMRQPHQWEGISLFDDLEDLQRVKTVLMRQTLDNLYWQNNPQPVFQDGSVKNPDAVFNPEFGKPIKVSQGIPVNQAYDIQRVPFVAKESFGMLEYIDQEAQDRTGINDASAGLAPDALQNMTAKASAMIEQGGIAQTEFMVRTVAHCLKRMFSGLLRLIIRHQDKPRMVRLRDEWVTFDPRHWNAEMDCVVNVGLGAGTRERDMLVMQQVMGIQQQLLEGFGPDNPFVKPENISNTLSKLVESAGLKTPSLYFTEPDPAEIEQKMSALRNAPDPEQQKLQANMQLEQMKMQANRDKEKAQMEADLVTKKADRESKMLEIAAQNEIAREKMVSDRQMKAAELAQIRELELLKIGAKDGENGPVTYEDERNAAFIEALQGVLGNIQSLSQIQNAPKRVVRDENGDVIGVEPVIQ